MLNSPTLTDSDAHTLAYSEITYNSPTQTTDDDPLHPVHSQKHSLRHNLSTFTSRCVFAICVAFMLIVFACAMLKISMEFSKSGR